MCVMCVHRCMWNLDCWNWKGPWCSSVPTTSYEGRNCGRSVCKSWKGTTLNHHAYSSRTGLPALILVFPLVLLPRLPGPCSRHPTWTSKVDSRKKLPPKAWEVLVSSQRITGPREPCLPAPSLYNFFCSRTKSGVPSTAPPLGPAHSL